MNDNISRKAVLVLVVLALMISVLSTTLVLNSVYSMGGGEEQTASSIPSARVSLTVPEQPAPSARANFNVPGGSP